jgi:hypothetical protein
MDSTKARKFNQKMGRPKYSKGGYIKKLGNRQYFDAGGIAQNIAPGAAVTGNPTNTNGSGVGGISNLLGLNAQSANLTQGTSPAQLNAAYENSNNALNAQVGLTNTLTPQAQTGVNAQNQILGQELGIASGTGPNPALAQLAQTTGQNVNQEAALLAGQRGAGANPGLAARNIATAGTQAEQQAAGEGATLAAQQEIAAQNNAANLAGTEIGQTQNATTALNTGQQNEQNILQGANSNYNNTAAGMQSNINSVNAQNNRGILGGITSGLSSLTGGLFEKGGEVGKDGEIPKVPAHAKHKLDFVHKMTKMGLDHFDSGGAISANPLVGAITNNGMASQPQGPGYTQVAPVAAASIAQPSQESGPTLADEAAKGFKSGQAWKTNRQTKLGTSEDSTDAAITGSNNPLVLNKQATAMPVSSDNSSFIDPNDTTATITQGDSGYQNAAHGGTIWDMHPSQHAQISANHFNNYFGGGETKKVEAMVSPGERYWNPEEVEMIKHGADPMKVGKVIPGKDKVPGKDSLKNDTVPATLEEGGVVNPLHVEKTKNSDKARLFVLKSLRATGKHMKKPQGMK